MAVVPILWIWHVTLGPGSDYDTHKENPENPFVSTYNRRAIFFLLEFY